MAEIVPSGSHRRRRTGPWLNSSARWIAPLLVMKITRQQNASRNQGDCDDERQPINNHPLPVIVFAGTLVFCEAQQRSDICPTFLGEPAQPHGTAFGGLRYHWLRPPQVFEVAG